MAHTVETFTSYLHVYEQFILIYFHNILQKIVTDLYCDFVFVKGGEREAKYEAGTHFWNTSFHSKNGEDCIICHSNYSIALTDLSESQCYSTGDGIHWNLDIWNRLLYTVYLFIKVGFCSDLDWPEKVVMDVRVSACVASLIIVCAYTHPVLGQGLLQSRDNPDYELRIQEAEMSTAYMLYM